jgi:hypothetical protein
MSEASERLRLLESDHLPDGWPAVQMRDITSVLDELDAMSAARAATEIEWHQLRQRLAELRAISHPQNEHNRAIDDMIKDSK